MYNYYPQSMNSTAIFYDVPVSPYLNQGRICNMMSGRNEIMTPRTTSTRMSIDMFEDYRKFTPKQTGYYGFNTNYISDESTIHSAPVQSTDYDDLLQFYKSKYCLCLSATHFSSRRVLMESLPKIQTPKSAPVKTSAFDHSELKASVTAPKPVVLRPAPLSLRKKDSFVSDSAPESPSEAEDCENMDKRVESIIQSTLPDNIFAKNGAKGVSRRRLFHLRQDVITKTIFRALRKYYLKEFRAYFDFTKETSLNQNNEDERLLRKADSYLTKTVGEPTMATLKIFLLSLLDTKKRFISLSYDHEVIREKLSGLLYNFNKNKMQELMKQPEFSTLVLYFLNQPDIINVVVKTRSDHVTMKAYEEQIEKLRIQCMKNMRH